MYAEIIYLGEAAIDPMRLHEPTGRMIDLIQWYEPVNTAPAYAKLNALGFVKVVLGTDDLPADLERSLPFYERLGFEATPAVSRASSMEEARARGFDSPFSLREAMLRHAADGSRLMLSQWTAPFDPTPPHPLPINHAGIQ